MDQINFNNNKFQVHGDLDIFSNMTTEEVEILLPSGMCKIPHSGYDRCCLGKSTPQTVPTGTGWTKVNWDVEAEDTNGLHSLSTDSERITIQKTGNYQFFYKTMVESDDKFSYSARVYKNDSIVIDNSLVVKTGSKNSTTITLEGTLPIIRLSAGDFLVIQVNHDDNFPKDIVVNGTLFFCERRY